MYTELLKSFMCLQYIYYIQRKFDFVSDNIYTIVDVSRYLDTFVSVFMLMGQQFLNHC